MSEASILRYSEAASGDVAPQSAPLADDYRQRNRAAWERWAPYYAPRGREAWMHDELRWGIWATPEAELGLLTELPAGADIVELGCGTAGLTAWLARLGFRSVGVDFSRAQLETASQFAHEFDLRVPLVHADGEALLYEAESFDCAVSEYGVSLWSDPRQWLPEASRVLRPQGRLIFIVTSAMLMAVTPRDGRQAGDRLVCDYFADERVEFAGDDAIEFHLTHGSWVDMLRETGFTLERLIETRPQSQISPRFGDFVSSPWARRWPSEEVWVARKAR
jgi:ubiquinone/menaquinone biosynthesis C-methylase UbiE